MEGREGEEGETSGEVFKHVHWWINVEGKPQIVNYSKYDACTPHTV